MIIQLGIGNGGQWSMLMNALISDELDRLLIASNCIDTYSTRRSTWQRRAYCAAKYPSQPLAKNKGPPHSNLFGPIITHTHVCHMGYVQDAFAVQLSAPVDRISMLIPIESQLMDP